MLLLLSVSELVFFVESKLPLVPNSLETHFYKKRVTRKSCVVHVLKSLSVNGIKLTASITESTFFPSELRDVGISAFVIFDCL